LVSLNFIIIFKNKMESTLTPDPNINAEGFPIDLDYGKFQYVRRLDSGGQGVVCLYRSLPHRDVNPPYPEYVAVKFDPANETMNLKETLWLKDETTRIKAEGRENEAMIPTYFMHSFYKSRRFFVMSYLPESIDDFIKSKGEKEKNRMITEAAMKMFDNVRWLHGRGFLHRDIKPSNFRVKDGKVYITDFGTYTTIDDPNT
jgi:serine/threonine protein kinase